MRSGMASLAMGTLHSTLRRTCVMRVLSPEEWSDPMCTLPGTPCLPLTTGCREGGWQQDEQVGGDVNKPGERG